MTLLYKPDELKLVPLEQVPVGTLVEVPGEADRFPVLVRLSDTSKKSMVMALGGEFGYEVFEWFDDAAIARVICSASDLRIRLGDPVERVRYDESGTLTVYTSGASIQSKPEKGKHRAPRISLSNWAPVDAQTMQGDIFCYRQWAIGQLNHTGEFIEAFRAE